MEPFPLDSPAHMRGCWYIAAAFLFSCSQACLSVFTLSMPWLAFLVILFQYPSRLSCVSVHTESVFNYLPFWRDLSVEPNWIIIVLLWRYFYLFSSPNVCFHIKNWSESWGGCFASSFLDSWGFITAFEWDAKSLHFTYGYENVHFHEKIFILHLTLPATFYVCSFSSSEEGLWGETWQWC